jgi:hypothetical protein
MSKVLTISVRCGHCQAWIPSPVYFSESETFDTSTLLGNQLQCRSCGELTACNKENMRTRYDGGGFLGGGFVGNDV